MRTFFVLLGIAIVSLPAAVGRARAEELKVKAMTFNIRLSKAPDGPNAWPRREAMVRDLIRQYQADFVGVQEAWPDQIAYLRDNLTDYSYLVRSREVDAEQGEAVPLFYRQARWKLDDAERGTFWLSDTPQVPGSKSWGNGIPRIATWGRFVEKATGRALYVFNVHFDHLSESSRVASAALLVQRVRDRRHPDPVLVLGDLNSGEDGGALKHLVGNGSAHPASLIDTFRKLHPQEQHVGTFHAFSGTRDGGKIDYVLASPDAQVLDARIWHDQRDGRYPSDHFPVSAEVAFPAALAKPIEPQKE